MNSPHTLFGSFKASEVLEELIAGPYKARAHSVKRFFNDTTRLLSQIDTIADREARIELFQLVYRDRKATWLAKKLPADLESHGANVLAAFFRTRNPNSGRG